MAPRPSLLAAGRAGFSVGPVSSEGAAGLSRTKARGTEGLLALGYMRVGSRHSFRTCTHTYTRAHACVHLSTGC